MYSFDKPTTGCLLTGKSWKTWNFQGIFFYSLKSGILLVF